MVHNSVFIVSVIRQQVKEIHIMYKFLLIILISHLGRASDFECPQMAPMSDFDIEKVFVDNNMCKYRRDMEV